MEEKKKIIKTITLDGATEKNMDLQFLALSDLEEKAASLILEIYEQAARRRHETWDHIARLFGYEDQYEAARSGVEFDKMGATVRAIQGDDDSKPETDPA